MRYLWAQQGEDGGFHSSTYGLLRSGQSLTPFVLNALLEVPSGIEPARPDALNRALSFIRKNTRVDGTLGRMDQTAADYAKIVIAAYDAAKAADPDCKVGIAAKSVAINYLDQAIKAGAELVFVWGGDGLVQRCVDSLVGHDILVAVLPVGTVNLFASNMGILDDLE